MLTGVVSPSESELLPFLKYCEDVSASTMSGFRFFTARFKGREIVCVICGICKTNAACATQILIDRFGVERIFLIGVCGAISSALRVFDTIVCTTVAHHDVKPTILTEEEPRFSSEFFECDKVMLCAAQRAEIEGLPHDVKLVYGKEVTGEQFVDQVGRETIIAKHAPLGVDMETAAVAQVCALNSVPFLALRTVTDTEEQSGLDIFRKNLLKAAEICAMTLVEILKQL